MTKILICDDHPIVASGLVGIFSEISDFQIVGIINTAREIAPSIHQLKPDIVFLDIEIWTEKTWLNKFQFSKTSALHPVL